MTNGRRHATTRRLNAAALALAFLTISAAAAPMLAGTQEVPSLTGPVNDVANVIDAASEAEIDRRIRSLESASGDAIVVLTVSSFAPFGSIEAFAVRVFEQAGIGARGKDNGALVVLAVNERRVKIEVGYGLEEFITDGFAGDTIRQTMLPAFRQGQYGEGLLAGTSRLIERVAERRGITLAEAPRPTASRRRPAISPAAVLVGVIVLILIVNMIRRSGPPPSIGRRRWPGTTWSGWQSGLGGFGGRGFGGGFGGGGGGGFGGFGGGRSGGGGASGGW